MTDPLPNKTDTLTAQEATPLSELQPGEGQPGEIVLSGSQPSASSGPTPTLQHALFQGLLDTSHEPPEPEDEDG